jgi:arsenate reductase
MAEGLLRDQAGDQFEVSRAGTRPVRLNPNAVKVMAELGIDISNYRSKSVDQFAGQEFDYVITVCDNAKESCPIFPGEGKRIHHSFEDPAAPRPLEQLATFRKVRRRIQEQNSGSSSLTVWRISRQSQDMAGARHDARVSPFSIYVFMARPLGGHHPEIS